MDATVDSTSLLGLTTIEHAILVCLARYRFLTAPQLLRLGVSPSRRYLYKALQRLYARRPRVLRTIVFGVHIEKGHLPALYYLTPAGSQLLAEAEREEPVAVPERVHRFTNDYFHRVNTIDCHIAIRQWAQLADSTVDFFHSYFDHSVERRPRTHVTLPKRSIIPDAIFRLKGPDRQERLFLLKCTIGAKRTVSNGRSSDISSRSGMRLSKRATVTRRRFASCVSSMKRVL
jgi:hypothetical protein